MNKVTIFSLTSFIFLCISSVTAYLLRYTNLKLATTLIIAFTIIIISAVISIIFRKTVCAKYIGLSLNSISLGFSIRSWYIYKGYDNSLLLMLSIIALCIGILIVFYFLLYIPLFDRHCGIYTIVFMIVGAVGYCFLVALTKTTWVSTLGFYLVIMAGFIIGMCIEADTFQSIMLNALICSFSVLIVAIIIAIIVLGGDGFDFDISGGSLDGYASPRNKKVNKQN